MLLDDLKAIQHRSGYLPEEELRAYSERTGTPLYQIQAVSSFYPHFRRTPPPRVQVRVCQDISCRLRGADRVLQAFRELGLPPAELEVHCASCLGQCDRAPAVLIGDAAAAPVEPGAAAGLVASPPPVGRPAPGRLGIDPYGGPGDYALLRRLREGALAAPEVVAALKESGLRGMGGAGFPTGTKWELVLGAAGSTKYVVCNADESEPGTVKDRHTLENAPHLVLEGMLVAARLLEAEEAILFIRHEYAGPRLAFEAELERARTAGLLEGMPPVRVFESPGGYILGEETALLEALEGKRGEPRNKPPFPGTHGLWGRPTLINNVETFALAACILLHGVEWYRSWGRNGGVGPKLIGISGDVARPGVYEVPLGITLRELIDEHGGGMRPGHHLTAVMPGGASSGFLPPSMVDTPVDFQSLARAGSMLGSGAVVVVGTGHCMLDLAWNVARFFRDESCGKCVPCRAGAEKLTGMLDAWRHGSGSEADLALLEELAPAMADASICGLGQIAPAPALSVLKYWPEEVTDHFRARRCQASVCPLG